MIRITYLHETESTLEQRDIYVDESLLSVTLAAMFSANLRIISVTH